jgi:hypothetical protein
MRRTIRRVIKAEQLPSILKGMDTNFQRRILAIGIFRVNENGETKRGDSSRFYTRGGVTCMH